MHQIELTATIAFLAGAVFGVAFTRGFRWAFVIPIVGGITCGLIAIAGAQERTFTITIPEPQLNYIGKIIGRQPYEEARPILDAIQVQVSAQIAREASAAREAERERLKSELSKEDKQP